ncbi:MAG TPA: hypothetical protein VFV66_37425 [Nonomuraea sp.]|nr:hypothetical protein [Nonomuraea sp.]
MALALALAAGNVSTSALLSDAEADSAAAVTASDFAATRYYLHDDPTPPSSDQASQAGLAMDGTAPVATRLFDYDTDHGAAPGRTIARGGSGPAETDLTRYQDWRGPTVVVPQTVSGTVVVELWTAMAGFEAGRAGDLRVHLRDRDTVLGTTTEIATAAVSAADWQGAVSGWVKRRADIVVAGHTLVVGHQLELKVTVPAASGGDLWLAYDTTLYRSRVTLP